MTTPALLQRLIQLPRDALIALVRGYRLLLKPWLGSACRFEPTCSAYALEALQRHGALAGATLAGGRLLRCQPWCNGGCDPVPAAPPRLFAWLGPPSAATDRPDPALPGSPTQDPAVSGVPMRDPR